MIIILIIIAIIQNLVTEAGNQLIQIEKRTRDPTCAKVCGYYQMQM